MPIPRRGRILRDRIQYGDGARHEKPAQRNPAHPAALDADLRAGRAGGGDGGAAFPHAALRAFSARHRALAALLSHATEAVAAKTGDAVGGLLNATLGNLTELIIAITALHAGQYMLVKASIAGAIVTNALFMLGACLLLGGLRYHVQEYNRAGARLHSGLLLMATVALLAPSAVADLDLAQGEVVMRKLSVGLAILLIIAYALGLLFSLKTHKELFASAEHGEGEEHWPIGVAVGTLLVVTVLVALVSEIFVESVQKAAETFGMSPAFVGFIIVSLVGAAAEFAVAFSAARKNRLDM